MAARAQVIAYQDKLSRTKDSHKSIDLDNIDPGVRLHDINAIHPLTGKPIPVYIASYVLADYGPGAVMGVPFNDERDCSFALENNLPLIQVLSEDDSTLVNSTDKFNGMGPEEAATAIVAHLEETGLATWQTQYRLRDWLVSRQRYWGCPIPVLFCEQCGQVGES